VPTTSEERELKLLVPADFQVPPLTGIRGIAGVAEGEPLELSATYYDTPDLRLMNRGVTLRCRVGEERGPVWTLKLPRDADPTLRSEVEFPGNQPQPPADVQDLVFGLTLGAPLSPVVEIKTRRRRWLLSDSEGAALAELVDDRVSVLDGSLIKDAFREIEIEARGIQARDLARIAAVIEKAGGYPEQRSKASRALELLNGEQSNGALPVEVSPRELVSDAVRPALAEAVRRVQMYDPYARLGAVEGVHRMRVAVRRLRSVLRTFAPIIDATKVEAPVEGLRWLGRLLGEVRDADVLLMHLEAEMDAPLQSALGPLRERRQSAMRELAEGMRAQRYVEVLKTLEALAGDEQFVTPSEEPCETALPALVASDWRKLRKAARALGPDAPEESLHRVRILGKRARYAAEMAAGYTTGKTQRGLRDFAARAETIQNVLGEHQDATLARDALLAMGQEEGVGGATGVQIGRLAERSEQRAIELRARFRKLWRRMETKQKFAWSKA